MKGRIVQCQAKSKRTRQQCRNHAMIGQTVCRNHGGKTPRGSALPQTKHGRYSRYLPERLADRYAEAASDPELLSLRQDVALLDVRLAQLAERAGEADSSAAVERIREAWSLYLLADDEDKPDMLKSVGEAIEASTSDIGVWREIADQLEGRRKLTETERKRLVEMRQMVRVDQAMTLVAAVIASVKSHVDDPKARDAISRDITGLVHATR